MDIEGAAPVETGPPERGQPASKWDGFHHEMAACSARLMAELRAASTGLAALLVRQEDRLGQLAAETAPGRSVDAVSLVYRECLQPLLLDAAASWRAAPPLERVLAAFDEYDRAIEQLAEVLLQDAVGSPLGLRTRRRRRAAQGRLVATLGEMSLDMMAPWQALRRAVLSSVSAPWPDGGPSGTLARLQARRARHEALLDDTLSSLEKGLPSPADVERELSRRRPRAASSATRMAARADRHRQFLGRQARAVAAQIDLEARLAQTDASLVSAAGDTLLSIRDEHEALLLEIGAVLGWLDAWRPRETSAFPPSTADVVPAATRLRAFAHAADGIVATVPVAVEVPATLTAGPGLRRAWATQSPRETARRSLETIALPAVAEGLASLERQHRGIIVEIERAREVVAFARETTQADEGNPRIEQEGVENARALLQFHRQYVGAIPADVEPALVEGLLEAFERTYRTLDEGQLGLLRHAARDGLPRATRVLAKRAAAHARTAAATAIRGTARGYRAALVAIGWIPAPSVAGTPVVARGYLTRTLGAEGRLERLPLIYQRLFRLVPVDDPRFLVGRQRELEALADARALWEQGRDAGVLLVGARGSGKTSLINCASQRLLAGLDIVRSEFVERLTQPEEMLAFLGALLKVEPGDVERELTSRRRVIVLEELERTFLRTPHGFGAIRTLLGIISRTSRHNLWIVSVNHSCFRLLNASLRLDPHFSHQINAMAVEQPHLRDAILMRHNLSGLRLRFAPSPDRSGYVGRLLRTTGVPFDAETDFFDALYRESGGVFRSAFALWQRYIDRVEGGVLSMKPPASPEYEPIAASLDTLDLFTLTALLQHGSLTPREHSKLFRIDDTKSRAWLDNLLARELIEPDPGRYGYRVVPDAAQIVRQTLFRRNLG